MSFVVLEFDVTQFRAEHPQFSDMTDAQLQGYWDIACELSGLNKDGTAVKSVSTRKNLLNLLTCHIATLQARGSESVGLLASASEGSVSASFGAVPTDKDNWWYLQTQCGAVYWNIMKRHAVGGIYFASARC